MLASSIAAQEAELSRLSLADTQLSQAEPTGELDLSLILRKVATATATGCPLYVCMFVRLSRAKFNGKFYLQTLVASTNYVSIVASGYSYTIRSALLN